MKTEKELKELKEEYTELNKKLAELSEDELKQVTGGTSGDTYKFAQENPENTCDNAQDGKDY